MDPHYFAAYGGQFLLMLAWLSSFGWMMPKLSSFPTLKTLGLIQFLLLVGALFLLAGAHVADNFALLNVAQHSHTHKPLIYKIAGIWASHEGSMLLWITMLSGYGMVWSRSASMLSCTKGLILHQGLVSAFILFMIIACDPFVPLAEILAEGQDLNPVLQDLSLTIHPPMLYLGTAGLSVPFLMGILALINKYPGQEWAAAIRPWVLLAWGFLTMGLTLGSFWAYYELGWGGWWYWDPVENVALLPWLSATALIHGLRITQNQKALYTWSVFLSLFTFITALLGLVIVRSGLLTSVHSFAVDPERGGLLMLLTGFIIFFSFALFFYTFKRLSTPPLVNLLNRAGAMWIHNLFMIVGLLSVALGTFYPLLCEIWNIKLTVGAPYFNATFVPLMVPIIYLMALGPWLSWQEQKNHHGMRLLMFPILGTLLAGLLILTYGKLSCLINFMYVLAGLWVIFSSVWYGYQQFLQRRFTLLQGVMLGAHMGMGLMVIGIAWTTHHEQEQLTTLAIGENLQIADFTLHLKDIQNNQGPNYQTETMVLEVTKNSSTLSTTLYPEKRFYNVQKIIHTETAIFPSGFDHLYILPGDAYEGSRWGLRVMYKPWVSLIWLGGLLMGLSGLIGAMSLVRSTYRSKLLKALILLWAIEPAFSLNAHEQLPSPQLEAKARSITQTLICPDCVGQTLDESPTQGAITLRRYVRQCIAAGWDEKAIFQSLEQHYGADIFQKPSWQKSTIVLWILPWLLAAIVFGIVFGIGLYRQKKLTQNN